ncbi:MAG: LysR family transcriptional regulator [Pseudomonadota bacterium]|uniref:LysR family transcriptional regulator n=1 Tax=Fodinicurvata fenggangensis TaxID=1121830 RepID=UPI00047B4023|nr:LysR family transcriptional regulator [Fodinicurvata fenggangensis]
MSVALRHIRAFVLLAEELHFNRAAERLHISQPALSRTLRELEESVGTKLINRTTRSAELTEAGRAFLLEAQLGVGHLEHAVNLARYTAQGIYGELRIAYMDFAINGRLPELIRAFREAHPSIRLDLSFMPTTRQRTALMEHRIDMGFLIGSFENDRIHNYTFDYDSYVALLPASHPLANVASLRLSDLANEPFVLGNSDYWAAHRERLFVLCHESGFFPRILQEASSSEGIFGLVAAGTGVSVYSSCVRNLQRRGLVIKPLDDITRRIPICAAWDESSASPGLQTFTEFLCTHWDRTHDGPRN